MKLPRLFGNRTVRHNRTAHVLTEAVGPVCEPLERRVLLTTLAPPGNPFADRTTGISSLLHWDAVPGATGYVIERKSASGMWENFTTVPASTTSFDFSGFDPTSHYEYRLKAQDTTGAGDPSAAVPVDTTTDDSGLYRIALAGVAPGDAADTTSADPSNPLRIDETSAPGGYIYARSRDEAAMAVPSLLTGGLIVTRPDGTILHDSASYRLNVMDGQYKLEIEDGDAEGPGEPDYNDASVPIYIELKRHECGPCEGDFTNDGSSSNSTESGVGTSGGVGATAGESFLSGTAYADNTGGYGTSSQSLPHLVLTGGMLPTGAGAKSVAVVDGGTLTYFDRQDATTPFSQEFGGRDTFTQVGGDYVLTDQQGTKMSFYGLGETTPKGLRGRFRSLTDPSGNKREVTSYDPDGKIEQMAFEDVAGSLTETWDYAYVASGTNAGRLASMTQKRKDAGGILVTERVVEYEYYDGSTGTSFGSRGDLKIQTVKDGSGAVIDSSYYRYYVDGETGGYRHALKYSFGHADYARLKAEYPTPETASNEQVKAFASLHLVYDESRRVIQRDVQGEGCSACTGGIGTYGYTYTYTSIPESVDDYGDRYNRWNLKQVESLPDGNQNIVYSNADGQPLLTIFKEFTNGTATGKEWKTFYRYDGQGRQILKANPSAVTGYDESKADLLNSVGGNFQYLSDSVGKLEQTDYDGLGYVTGHRIRRGEFGTDVQLDSTTYTSHSGGGSTIYPVASTTVFAGANGTGSRTTNYSYTYASNSVHIASKTTTMPVVGSGQNGPGVATSTTSSYDSLGRLTWMRDEDGFLSYTEYDQKTGAAVKMIRDVNTALTGDFTNLPAGWSTPASGGLHLVTRMIVDGQGRATKTTDSNGNVTYAVYNDPAHEVRTYRGWNATTGRPTGPTEVWREDRPGSYTEMLTMAAAPAVSGSAGSYVPTGTESIFGIESLSRSYTNAAGQTVSDDQYFNLAGVDYSQNKALTGAVQDQNYYRTTYSYDDRGRLKQTVDPTGTVSRTDYDGLGRATAMWAGINDNLNGLVQTMANEYDAGGVGDSNLTKLTTYVGGGAADRVATYSYDWRDRAVATKGGVQASEAGTTNVQRQIAYVTYDNLGEVTFSETFDGDIVSVVDSNSDGVPDRPAASLLRTRAGSLYDEQGRVYRQSIYSVTYNSDNDADPTNGTIGGSLDANVWYDLRGNTAKMRQAGGLVQKMVYDGAGRATASYSTDGGGDSGWGDALNVSGDAVLQQQETTYDKNGNAILSTGRQRFHDESATGALGSPTSGVRARVSYAGMYYDAADRLIAQVNVGTNGGTAWVRPATVPARSDTALVASYTYDPAGRPQDVIDPRGIITHTTYDLLGRTTATIEAYNGSSPSASTNRTTRYTYDGLGDVLTMTADLPFGQADQITKYDYAARTANGDGLDSNAILTAVIYPDTATGQPNATTQREVFSVNRIGQKTKYTDRNGTVHEYLYDVLGRLGSDRVTTFGSGVDASVARLTYAYDSAGRPFTFTSRTSSDYMLNRVKRTYNGFGQTAIEYQSHSGDTTSSTPAVRYAYSDAALGSRPTSMTYPSGRLLRYEYGPTGGLNDRIGRLSFLADGTATTVGTHLEEYAYLGLAAPVQRSRGNGVNLTYIGTGTGDAGDQYTGLDRFGRVVDQRWVGAGGADADRFKYGYDRDGNRLYRDNVVNPAFGETYAGGAGYDQLNRLTSFARGTLNAAKTGVVGTAGRSQTWNLDALGNWQSSTTDGATESRAHDAQNRLTGVGTATLGYSPNGEMKTDEQGQQLTYDAWGRLVGANTNSSGGYDTSSYTFDALGRRTRTSRYQNVNGSCSNTVSDSYYSLDWQVLEEGTPDYGCSSSSYSAKSQYVWSPVYVDAFVLRDELNADTSTGPAGSLDTSFGSGGTGVATVDFGGSDYGRKVAVQADGKILVLGTTEVGYNFAIARFNANGTLDTSYGNGGKQTIDFGGSEYGLALAIQPDGKAVAVGYTSTGGGNFAVARLTTTGFLDSTFDGDGKLTTDLGSGVVDSAGSVAIQTDGRIVVAGNASNSIAVARYNSDGSLDPTFDGDGKRVYSLGAYAKAYGVALQPDGKIVAAGYYGNDFAVVRVLSNGAPDTSFGSGGLKTVDMGGTDIAYEIAVQPDGKIVAVGENGGDLALVRLTASGGLDSSFGTGGKVFYGDSYKGQVGHALVLQPDGKIVVAGEENGVDWLLVRFNANGTPDASFGTSGGTVVDLGGSERVRGVALQSDGKILVAGNRGSSGSVSNDLAVGRFNAGGVAAGTRRLYVQQDANYNVTSLTDASGNVVERYAYDPYGAATYLTPSWGVRAGSAYGWQYLHQGGRLDGGSGLYEFRNRSYDPTLGRWTRQDPAGYVDGASLYQVGNSNEINHLDPSGLWNPDGHFYVTYITAVASGTMSQQEAYEFAYYSELPDERDFTDATAMATLLEEAKLMNRIDGYPSQGAIQQQEKWTKDVFDQLHQLHGGDIGEIIKRRKCLEKLMNDPTLKPWEKGFINHAYGDTFAHVYKDKDGIEHAYGWPYGHGKEIHRPDYIHLHPHAINVYAWSVLRILNKGQPASQEQAEKMRFITENTGISREPVFQSSWLANIALLHFGLGPYQTPNVNPNLFLPSQGDVQALIDKMKKNCGCASYNK